MARATNPPDVFADDIPAQIVCGTEADALRHDLESANEASSGTPLALVIRE